MDYLKNGLTTEIFKTLNGSHAFFKILKIRNPVFAVSNQASGVNYAFGELCRIQKINAGINVFLFLRNIYAKINVKKI